MLNRKRFMTCLGACLLALGLTSNSLFADASATLRPTGDGHSSQWTDRPLAGPDWEDVNEVALDATDYIYESFTNDVSSFTLDISSLPTGASITRVDVHVWYSKALPGGIDGTFQTRYRLDGSDVPSGSDLSGGSSTTPVEATQNINVDPPVVKDGATALEIGVVKTATDISRVRVYAIDAVVQYDCTDDDGDGVCNNVDQCDGDDATGDTDGDGVCNDIDECPGFDDSADADGDGVADGCDPCPADNPDDTDGDGVCDSDDPCPLDNPDDIDGDGVCDSDDQCPGFDDNADADGDGVADGCDPCPADNPDDTDGDGVCDDIDDCPNDPNKVAVGVCGCGVSDDDTDGDGTADCNDGCPADPNKQAPGDCGCGTADTDTDGDGIPDCNDPTPNGDSGQPIPDPEPHKLPCGFLGVGTIAMMFGGLMLVRGSRRRRNRTG